MTEQGTIELISNVLKVGIALVLGCLIFFIFKAVNRGKMLARSHNSLKYEEILAQKRSSVAGMFCTTLLSIVLIESLVLVTGERMKYPGLFWFHLVFAGSFLVLLFAIRFRFTGLYNPAVHRWMVYLFISCGLIALVSGGWMLWNL